ncbi:MAG: YhcH/YjgK/YiaL family protein [Eubacterium sp.]|nr:YhcH/YjgK/YiaL family protein [Eubacterium sp.]
MIFGNIHCLDEYPFLEKAVQECFAYAQQQDLSAFTAGCHEIDGKRLFVNIVEYTTTEAENRFWEAHRQYLDLHLMLCGTEQIDLNFIANLQQKDYQEKDDFLPLEGDKNSSVILRDGDFLICFPNDGHRTAVAVDQPEKIKKAIFKIQI